MHSPTESAPILPRPTCGCGSIWSIGVVSLVLPACRDTRGVASQLPAALALFSLAFVFAVLLRHLALGGIARGWPGATAGIATLVATILAAGGWFNTLPGSGAAMMLPFPLLVLAAATLSPTWVVLVLAGSCAASLASRYFGTGIPLADLAVFNTTMVLLALAVTLGKARPVELIAAPVDPQAMPPSLHPHFLFNTLNVIRALVHADPARADKAVTSLAGLLRGNLRTTGIPLVRLAEEMVQVRTMLELASLRFGERLETRIDVPDELLETKIPPMLLLNLVENAITHGIGKSVNPAIISIVTRAADGGTRITILNTGRLDGSSPRGLGTSDAMRRLDAIFDGRAGFQLSQADASTVSADLFLPVSNTFQ